MTYGLVRQFSVLALFTLLAACNGSAGGIMLPGTGGQTQGTISISPTSLTAGTVSTFWTQTLTASGGTGALTWSDFGDLPAGITLNTASATLSGTPTSAGSYSFWIRVDDSTGAFGSREFSLIINPVGGGTITISPTTVPAGTAGQSYSQSFTASGGTGTITWSQTGNLPSNVSFSDTSASLSGTPSAAGSFSFTLDVSDSNGATGTQSYTLVINSGSTGGSAFQAEAGTDVWFIDFDIDADNDGTGDFDEALVVVGLTAQRQSVIVSTLGSVYAAYGNNSNGTLNSTGGIPVTFCYVRPAGWIEFPSSQGSAVLNNYNVCPLVHRSSPTGTGEMIFDSSGSNADMENATVENNNWTVAGLKGVFPVKIAEYGTSNFERFMAIFIAHEPGHSLGLGHVSTDTIMVTLAGMNTLVEFNSTNFGWLQSIMPGANR